MITLWKLHMHALQQKVIYCCSEIFQAIPSGFPVKLTSWNATCITSLNYYIIKINKQNFIKICKLTGKISINLLSGKNCVAQLCSPRVYFDVLLYLNGIIINIDPKYRFEGVWLDKHINWSYHVNYVLSKITKTMGSYLRFDFLLTKRLHFCYIICLFIFLYNIVILCEHPITLQG